MTGACGSGHDGAAGKRHPQNGDVAGNAAQLREFIGLGLKRRLQLRLGLISGDVCRR
jgi:hypothetical protein